MAVSTEERPHPDEQPGGTRRPDASAIRSRLLRYTTPPATRRESSDA